MRFGIKIEVSPALSISNDESDRVTVRKRENSFTESSGHFSIDVSVDCPRRRREHNFRWPHELYFSDVERSRHQSLPMPVHHLRLREVFPGSGFGNSFRRMGRVVEPNVYRSGPPSAPNDRPATPPIYPEAPGSRFPTFHCRRFQQQLLNSSRKRTRGDTSDEAVAEKGRLDYTITSPRSSPSQENSSVDSSLSYSEFGPGEILILDQIRRDGGERRTESDSQRD